MPLLMHARINRPLSLFRYNDDDGDDDPPKRGPYVAIGQDLYMAHVITRPVSWWLFDRRMASDGAVVSSLIVCILLVTQSVHVNACYLRNCPIGGKRALVRSQNDNALSQWIDPFNFEPHDVS